MKQKLLYYLIALCSIHVHHAFGQQPTEEWSKRYNGAGSQDDYTTALAMDAAGNSYVAATTIRTYNSEVYSNIVVIKISPTGQMLWEKVFDKEQTTRAEAIAIDNQGGVFVTGSRGRYYDEYDYITIRFDATTGEQGWVQTYNGTLNGADEALAITTDNQGGVFVTGSSVSVDIISNVSDFITIKYDALTGAQTWVQRYNGPSDGHDRPEGIVVDNQGGVYVTGYSQGSGNQGSNATVRYNAATGSQSWVSRFSTAEDAAIATSIALDFNGGVYVTGYSTDFENSEIITVRYNAANGAEIWKESYNSNGSNYDMAVGVAVDQNGGVFVTGYNGSWFEEHDYLTLRYDASSGTLSWEQRYDAGGDTPIGIAVDNQGGVYVTGGSFRDNHYDFLTVRHDAGTGTPSWVQRYDGGSNGIELAQALAVSPQGGIVVTGISKGGITHTDLTTIHYSAQSGSQTWINNHDIISSMSDNAIAIVVDAAGNSYVTGSSVYYLDIEIEPINSTSRIVTIKYSPSGEELWVKAYEAGYNSRSTGIALDESGGVYIAGYTDGASGNYDYVTIRYDAETGDETWIEHYNGEGNGIDQANAITVDNLGGVYVTGNSAGAGNNFNDYVTIRYDAATGNLSWVQRYNGIPYGNDRATGIAVDTQGSVYVTGYSAGQNASNDYATIRYNALTGAQAWVNRFDGGNTYDIANAIAVDNQGGVFVTGYAYDLVNSEQVYATVRYNAATGQENWVSRYNGEEGGFSYANALAVDNAGGVYVTGNSSRETSNGDFATIRYEATTGQQSWVQRYTDSGNNSSWANAIAIGNQGDLYVTGYTLSNTGRVFSTVKYIAATGEQVWDAHTSGPDDAAGALAVDAQGNVIVTGYSRQLATDHDFLTVKYRQQQTPCTTLASAYIKGSTTAVTGSSGATYTLVGAGTRGITWRISDTEGRDYTRFSGQGTSSIKVKWPSSPGAFRVSVAYAASGDCPAQSAVTYVHVFDPEAGFVTGGGWLYTPAYADHALMQQPGKAHFSLQAKYQKGGKQVQGQTQLRLESGSLLFRSTSHEARTLVIDGDQAFYLGQGRLSHRDHKGRLKEDKRRFAFLVAATDGQLERGKGWGKHKGKYNHKEKDKLRILIWELNEDGSRGAVVYDNQAAGSRDENARASQRIGGGEITIHSPQFKGKKDHHLLALEETALLQGLTAYPTAFHERTTIAFTAERDSGYTLELYDLKGALVKRIAGGTAEAGKRYEHELQAGDLAKGLYLVRLLSDGSMQTVKVVVQR